MYVNTCVHICVCLCARAGAHVCICTCVHAYRSICVVAVHASQVPFGFMTSTISSTGPKKPSTSPSRQVLSLVCSSTGRLAPVEPHLLPPQSRDHKAAPPRPDVLHECRTSHSDPLKTLYQQSHLLSPTGKLLED